MEVNELVHDLEQLSKERIDGKTVGFPSLKFLNDSLTGLKIFQNHLLWNR
jgi:hypothetical protein